MNKARNRRGFTMAELLIVVAIIGVLGAIGVQVWNQRQRSLARLERDTIAREIFIAAQNHLTRAYGQGYLDLGLDEDDKLASDPDKKDYDYGYPDPVETDKDIFYLVYPADGTRGQKMLNVILPPMAIDETTLGNGSFIIRYQRSTGLVLDVFYLTREGSQYGNTLQGITEEGYQELLNSRGNDNLRARENYSDGSVLGWYGSKAGEVIDLDVYELKAPDIEVINAEQLKVIVTDNNLDHPDSGTVRDNLQLIITGVTSGVHKTFTLKGGADSSGRVTSKEGIYTVILDDITQKNFHFAELEGDDGTFIAGEDIIITAKAFSTTVLANIGESGENVENSLFAAIVGIDDKVNPAYTMADIGNMRHLENLHPEISGVNYKEPRMWGDVHLAKAEQITDLDWAEFCECFGGTVESIQIFEKGATTGTAGFRPIDLTDALEYDGMWHSISNVWVECEGPAGLFGEATSLNVHDLELIDFTIASTAADGTAGALAGALNSTCSVSDVIARNSTNAAKVNITGATAGGLIGDMEDGTLEYSAAAVIVGLRTVDETTITPTTAGGLVGTCGAAITCCYSGGHTKEGSYDQWVASNPYDVTGATAGGLVGDYTGTKIKNSYSTCSVSGTTAGGFVGTADADSSVKNSYCTGLVDGASVGAFAGCASIDAANCRYYEIINDSLTPLLKDGDDAAGTADGITPLDAMPADDDWTLFNHTEWNSAYPYDTLLTTIYGGKYCLKTVAQLDAALTLEDGDYVSAHYGDWPAPEAFVFNEAA